MTKERPILFTGVLASAVIGGKKTQTRRVVKSNSRFYRIEHVGPEGSESDPHCWGYEDSDGHWWLLKTDGKYPEFQIPCPYGVPGDRLWVREPWRAIGWGECPIILEYKDGTRMEDQSSGYEDNYEKWHERMWFQCMEDCEKAGLKTPEDDEYYEWDDRGPITRWRPSIHQPRWASRITFDVASVRLERIQDISEEDIKAEGIDQYKMEFDDHVTGEHYEVTDLREKFQLLWESINGPDSWDENPWVWVIGVGEVQNGSC